MKVNINNYLFLFNNKNNVFFFESIKYFERKERVNINIILFYTLKVAKANGRMRSFRKRKLIVFNKLYHA